MTASTPTADVVVVTKVPLDRPEDGGTIRSRALVDALRAAGLRVQVVAVRSPGRIARLRPDEAPAFVLALLRVLAGVVVRPSALVAKWLTPRVVLELVRLRRASPRAVVVLDHAHTAVYGPLAPRRWILSTHNVEHELVANYAASAQGPRRVVASIEAVALRRFEVHALRAAERVVTVSEHDADLVRRVSGRAAGSVLVAPNGVRDACFGVVPERGPTVIFVAHLGWRPNVDAAIWLVREVWPHVRRLAPELTLQLVGRSPAPQVRSLHADDIEVVGDVPSVEPYLARAAVATAPLLAAGGTRIKILEALACDVPVVATPLGALGLEHVRADVLAVRADGRDFAEGVVALWRGGPAPGVCRDAVAGYRWIETVAPVVRTVRGWDA